MSETIAEIWEGDLFSRQEEAINLEAYIESICQRPSSREDSKGFVLAVDADYGMGKTFFLKRFAEQLAINHPVAYIDAWKDDLQDEPLIALIATLEEALEKAFGEIDGDLAKTKDNVWDKFKKVSGIVGKGLLKKGAGLIITASAAEAVSTILEGQDEDFTETIKKELEDVGKDTVNGVVSISKVIGQSGNLEEKIKSFKDGQKAIEDLKDALAELVKAISKDGKQAPIVIIIDELDRCRPNYAIKLLEEVKHLFDVKGIVFILGVNMKQIETSSSIIYGTEFNRKEYFSRFYSRKYSMFPIKPTKLVNALIEEYKISKDNFIYNIIATDKTLRELNEIIEFFVEKFKISARDLFKIFTIIQSSQSVLKNNEKLFLPYLLKVILIETMGEKFFNQGLLNLSHNEKFIIFDRHAMDKPTELNAQQYFSTIDDITAMSFEQLQRYTGNNTAHDRIINHIGIGTLLNKSFTNIKHYNELLNWVQRIE